MKNLRMIIPLLLGASLLLAACTITPAVPVTAGTPAAADTAGVMTETVAATETETPTVAATATDEATPAATDTALEAAPDMTTTTIVTTTVTTVTDGMAVSETEVMTDGDSVAGSLLPTPTAAAPLTVTAPVSPAIPGGDTSATTATTATTVMTDAAAGTILDVVNSTPGLETLATALTASGMAAALAQPGPLTLFAPNNEAFAAIPQDQLDTLLADPALLAPILQYHIVIDNVAANRLATLGSALSSLGRPITITVQSDGSLLVNDGLIIQADIPASNGAIHIIDRVLLPPAATP